mgnify:FL=1|jgi:uncharacterized membrane protein YhaH (DUF805 family)
MDIKWLLFSFDGRLNRLPYWGVVLLMLLLGAGFNFSVGDFGPGRPMTTGPAILESLVFLLFLWVGLAVQIKRWHDRDKSGWWALLNLIPVIGTLWILIECGFLRGTYGGNRFGPDPLGPPEQPA